MTYKLITRKNMNGEYRREWSNLYFYLVKAYGNPSIQYADMLVILNERWGLQNSFNSDGSVNLYFEHAEDAFLPWLLI